MEPAEAGMQGNKEISADPLPFARSYQMEALAKAIKENTIVFLETGSGKTLIAIMLLRTYAYLLRKPSPFIAVFLVPTVVLVSQQADVVNMHTDLKVGKYWGDMGVDFWDAATWKKQQDSFEVLVMTPKILLNALRHNFLRLDMIKVLIFDECHNARGRHPYACIMMEFYHRQLPYKNSQLPRIFGMTASPVKAKGSSSASTYWKQIMELENLMNSKVYTVVSESVLTKYIPFSTPKLKIYKHWAIPSALYKCLANGLLSLKAKHESTIEEPDLEDSASESASKKLSKLFSTFLYCLNELGVWLAFKAAESLSSEETDVFLSGGFDVRGETIVKGFSLDAVKLFSTYIPSGSGWCIGDDLSADMDAGYLSSQVSCLIESLLGYRNMKDLRCIIFVERVITAVVLKTLLSELLPKKCCWKTEYTAGNHSGFQSQSRKEQNKIVEEFRKGMVNIIVATSILEEGLDVQTCNLVIRFDPSATVCSFIQSRGRARMQNSDFLLMLKSEDTSTLNRVKNYLASGDVMREESLRHASLPCEPLDSELYNEVFYRVESTGAVVTLSSSVALIYFYCSRLPSDGYFKPSPLCEIDKKLNICTLTFPKNCPIPHVSVQGNIKTLKQFACLEACKQLHKKGALTDNLVPDIVVEEADAQELDCEPYNEEQANYFPPELVSCANDSVKSYHCYLIELERNFEYNIPLHHIVLAVRTELEFNDENMAFDLETERGNVAVKMKYVGEIKFPSEQVLLCQRFQITLVRVLLDHNLNKLKQVLNAFHSRNDLAICDYLLLPCSGQNQNPYIDWKCVSSVLFLRENLWENHGNCCIPNGFCRPVHAKNGLVCSCMLENCLVYTPHTGHVYCITGTLDNLDANSLMSRKNGEDITYKHHYKQRHDIDLRFQREPLLKGRRIFLVQNYLQRCRQQKERESSNAFVELPPELCYIIMSPISISTFYSYSFVPSIMHRIECLLLASNWKKMYADHCTQNVVIPTIKVLEAFTTKNCQEKFHLESLETLGDSFLKYATSQQLFKTNQNHHQGLLSIKRERIISNVALRKRGCYLKLQGFIRNEPFDPKTWIIPGDQSSGYTLDEESLSATRKVYNRGKRKIKSKRVADVVEALIGAFLSTGGEKAALSVMNWLGIKVDFVNTPYERQFTVQPERHINIRHIESLLNYTFRDASLLVEALTHGSYMLPEIPSCYQRLEFLGDSVLDYVITTHLYEKFPGMSPGLLTDLRSAMVNNDCFALSAVKFGLHKHILHTSQRLHKRIVDAVHNFEQLSLSSTFGWESEETFPKVLADILESLAGAIFVDSGYNKEVVFMSIRPLLEPMITPETVKFHPIRELNELCQKEHYVKKKAIVSRDKGVSSVTIEVEANGVTHKYTHTASDKPMAKKLAAKDVLKSLKESMFVT
ncbi:Endoribonuclease [Actinidia chinensis var. chinensis]|uniref:Endoribonuclease n=1 Tax=Actinidia chinensis var. chinensis TaxID=1590841 RepID=A0A2R6QAM7_ACTCC|nr:Endoribonuclease [Actinidia chinensis var. chinensis]